MKKLLYYLYQPYKFIVVLPMLGLSTFVLGISSIICTFLSQNAASNIFGPLWARVNSFVTPMLVSVTGKEIIDKDQSYVITSNHQSHYDIFVLYGWIGVGFKWVMKSELLKIPVLGYACNRMGHIFIDRSNPDAAKKSLQNARKKIENGTSILFFPEGTRSRAAEMLEFKKGAFIMALDLGIPILPVTIVNTRNILPPDTLRIFPGRARMIIHNPVDVTGYTRETIDRLIANVREVIQSGLDPS